MTVNQARLDAIDEQRRLNWRDFHPEDYCHRCGGRNVKSWHAPSPLWNAVVPDLWEGIICPQCFAELVEASGIQDRFGSWHFGMHAPDTALPDTDADGRTWDAETCLWVESKVAV